MPDAVIVSGSLAQRPGIGGHTWVFLQYLLGFRRLGWDVLFVDRLEPEMCMDESGSPAPVERSVNLRYLRKVMERFGLKDSWALLYDRGRESIGRPRRAVREHARGSAFLLNVMGFLDDEEILEAVPRRVFLDIDPGFGQMWRDLGLADLFRGHDAHVTIGENVGRPDCAIPTCGLDWIPTPQPVVLEQWTPARDDRPGAFSSIATWRGPFAPVDYRGDTYGLRVHEFRRFLELPRLTGRRFQVALDIHSAEVGDLARLDDHGWTRLDPRSIAGDPWAYRDFIRGSGAEFMVAKNMYVRARSGWFSDRSICYLASGRPVLAQDTGLGGLYPTGEGLLAYSTLEEAAAGVEEISRDYPRHARAARALAEGYFDSDRVLPRLLGRLGVA